MFEQKYNLSNAVHPGGGGEGGKGPRDTELDINFVLVKIMLSVIIFTTKNLGISIIQSICISRHL